LTIIVIASSVGWLSIEGFDVACTRFGCYPLIHLPPLGRMPP
jgi:hypothetical protein